MKPTSRLRSRRGSALIVVMFLLFMMGLLTTSMLRYSGNERRGNERNRLILRGKNMAENVALYASEQISTKVRKLRSVTTMKFTGTNALHLPPSSVLNTTYSTSSDVAVYGGIASTTALALITDTSDANYGLQVSTGNIPIVASSTVNHKALGSVKAFVEQDLQINMVPLFQFAIFYNEDLEVSPGADMVISGPVHTNGNLIARCQTGFSNTVQFTDRVTAVGGLFANTGYKGTIYNETDTADAGPGGTGPLKFQNPSGTVTDIKNSSSVWRDHLYGGSAVTTTTLANFKTFATNTYVGNLLTSVHNVPQLQLPGLDDTANNKAHVSIEPASASDSAALSASKFSRNVGLYIIVNPDDEIRSGTLPDESSVTMLPRSYRCWLNTTNNSTGAHTFNEVVLPGQPSYGYNNNGTAADTSDDYMYRNYLPNRYTLNTSVGSNQVLRIPQQDIGLARSYVLNGAHAAGVTTINVKTGIGKIRAGEVVTINSGRYLVMTDLTVASGSGSFTIAAPGLLGAGADGNTVTLNSPYGIFTAATGYTVYNAHALNATAINLRGSTNVIMPGSTITLNSAHKYLVTAASTTAPANTSTTYTVYIAAPGLRTTLANGNAFVNDTTSFTLGTGQDYQVNGAHAINATTVALAGGSASGTILPGNVLSIGQNRYTVTSALNGGSVTITPGLVAAVADTTPAHMDAYAYSGYAVGTATLSTSSTIIPDCYFYDLRRATNSNGHPFSRTSNTFTPRPIAKIDFDLARFKMAVGRTLTATAAAATVFNTDTNTTGYSVAVPAAGNWANNILNSSGTTTTFKHGTGATFNTYPAATNLGTKLLPDPFRIYFAPTAGTPPAGYATVDAAIDADPSVFATGPASFTDPWYDGITIYVHSVGAEVLTESSTGVRNRIDSGVRLINGRGPIATLSTVGKTGFSFGTNDAAYILGHFNADGTVQSDATVTTNPGGYSARYPEASTEKLASIMADAITILSQPQFTNSGSNYYQEDGWSDSLSGTRVRSSSYSTSWATTNPSSSNTTDGEDNGIVPSFMPTLGTYWPGTGSSRDTKFSPNVTEISACILTGIVKTDTHQHSGGVHNYPRLLEQWSGTGLYIRGSMVAMFTSEIATEPWSIRIYSGAGRYWGLHQSLRDAGHDVPLEPILLNAQRLSFRELTETEFNTKKTTILALP